MFFIAHIKNYDYYWNEATKEITQEYDPYYQVIGYAETMADAKSVVDDWI